jgi:SAM-dependent methyltransferase
MGVRKSLTRLFLGAEQAEAMSTARISRSPDRGLLLGDYFPAFAAAGGRILWVGCKPYTAGYPALLEAGGGEVWTTEIDPRGEAWGRQGRHRTGDICQADRLFGDLKFDAVLCNGVLGWGVDAPEDQARALAAMAGTLKPGGLLLLGWNTDKMDDPVAAGLTARDFTPASFAGLPSRTPVPRVTHVYDLLARR